VHLAGTTCCSARLRRRGKAADLTVESAYGEPHADVYDDLYDGRGKDYAAESAAIVRLVRKRRPDAASLLDVGCGTGRHLEHLAHEFAVADGAEPSLSMRARAALRAPQAVLYDTALPDLAVARRYDAIICMFSTIGYVGGDDGATTKLDRAVARMAAALTDGGVLVVEPWMYAYRYQVGHIGSDFIRTSRGRVLFRMSHSGLQGNVSVLTMRYVVGDADGMRSFGDIHLMTMYEPEDFEHAFRAAGLTAEFRDPGFGRGVVCGVAPKS
jgi:SAM-dependent methyltransferase